MLELSDLLGIDAAVEPVPRSALDYADEVFLATTAGGVMPAPRVGTRILGNDREEGWHCTPVRPLEAEAGE